MTKFKSIRTSDLEPREVYSYFIGGVVPRPIAFASTIDKEGNVNLSPYSFFNAFGSNPPTLVFSPTLRGKDATAKDTLYNIQQHPEVVVNIVNYPMVQQMAITSTEYPREIDEFVKGGFTPLASEIVKPPRVAESPVAFECKVNQVFETGKGSGSGNLVICEVLMIHMHEDVLDKHGKVDSYKLDVVGRMGGSLYVHATPDVIFDVKRPGRLLSMGIDEIPKNIRLSNVLTGNDLGKLGNIHELPQREHIRRVEKAGTF